MIISKRSVLLKKNSKAILAKERFRKKSSFVTHSNINDIQ